MTHGVTIVTHGAMPEGAPDDRLLMAALLARGATVRLAVWDDPMVDWSATPITVVRSTWDYHLKTGAWRAWIGRVSALTSLVNAAETLLWNSEKTYLLELAAAGLAVIPTFIVEHGGPNAVAVECTARGWTDIVIKPSIGASAHGAERFRGAAIAAAGLSHAAHLLNHCSVLVQPYHHAVEHDRERSLVVIGGEVSHAFTKLAFSGMAAGALEPHVPSRPEIELARHVLRLVPGTPLYARVDMLPSADGPLLMEVELIEPQLGLHLHPPASDLLAATLLSADHPMGSSRQR